MQRVAGTDSIDVNGTIMRRNSRKRYQADRGGNEPQRQETASMAGDGKGAR
jgi:hypothetical protein